MQLIARKPLIRIRDLKMTFEASGEKPLEVIKDLSIQIMDREFVSILGPSGCGKTTLLRIIAGLLEPSSGQIEYLDGRTIGSQRIGLVFQQANLMPWRSVADNIALPLELFHVPRMERHRLVQDMLSLVGLNEFADRFPRDISGGMAQRVAIARALIQDPDFLLMDEPFGSLDALTRDRMGTELLSIWQNSRKTVVMITHSISEAVFLSDRVIVLSPRPAEVALDLVIPLTRPREEKIRYQPAFGELARRLRKAIQVDASQPRG